MSWVARTRRDLALPVLAAAIVAVGWTVLAISAVDGQSGPSLVVILLTGVALLGVMTWRVHSWIIRRRSGCGPWSTMGRSLWEGAVTGVLMATVAYSFAVVGDGTAVTNFMLVIVMIPWMILGALVFLILAILVVTTTKGYGHSQRASGRD